MSIVVIGSINYDFITSSNRFPKIGETITGHDFTSLPGGKGANQAVAASRLGSDVAFVGKVGKDYIGDICIKNLRDNGVDVSSIEKVEGVSTGVAQITVAENDNSIIVVKGANSHVDIELVKSNEGVIKSANVVLVQFEIPMETVFEVIEICNRHNVTVILNPAPAGKVDKGVIEKVDYLTPNETELDDIFEESYEEILEFYPNKIVMTGGSKGAYYHNGHELVNIEAFPVKAVDTTGAGDTFNGALANAIDKGLPLNKALEFANKAASLSVMKVGAQSAMPFLDEIIE